MTRYINDEGLDLLKKSEGLELTAYRDGGGVLTIGYGHTGPDVKVGLRITQGQAEALLRSDLGWAQDAVEKNVKVPLNDNQFSALVSFTYNVGASAFKKSTLLKKLNQGSYQAVNAELLRWSNDNGKKVTGLYNRRVREGALFVKGGGLASSVSNPSTSNSGKLKKSGVVVAGGGAVLDQVQTTISSLSPFAETSQAIKILVAVLVSVGLAVTIYGFLKGRE